MAAKNRLRSTGSPTVVRVTRAATIGPAKRVARGPVGSQSRPRSIRPVAGPSGHPVDVGRRGAADMKRPGAFDVQTFLNSTGLHRRLVAYARGGVIFRQGDPCDTVMYVQAGFVKISVISTTGKQAIVAMLGPGEFFGVGGLAGQPVRMENATATRGTAVLVVDQLDMVRLLHEQHAMSDLLIAHLLMRTIRVEEDLIDQLFSSAEKRLARRLLMLASYMGRAESTRRVPAISQEALAEMVGTTRSRVNFFMKKFERLGFVDNRNGLRVHDSLLAIALQE